MTTQTHQAAQPAVYVAPEKAKRTSSRKVITTGACGRTCSGGYKCASTRHPHTLHLCNHSDCDCRWDLRHSGTGVSK